MDKERKFDREKEYIICFDYLNDLSISKIAKKYLTSVGHVWHILVRYGISRRPMSETMRGNKNSKDARRSPETRKKISKILKEKFKNGEINRFGKNGPNYKDGKYIKDLERREACRKRYNYRCQRCLRHQSYFARALDVHHIDYNPENNSPYNLIPLCDKHHKQTKGSREYWTMWYNLIVEYKNKEVV